MSKPLVSIVIPCFNVAKTVVETIDSVSAQTMGDFEIIAVDNNCTDTTLEVLKDVAQQEPRLRVIVQTVQGLSAARNAGIAAARGRYIALLDADDLWDGDYLKSHLTNLADGTCGISYSRVRMIDVQGRPTGQVTQPQLAGLNATDLLRSNPCTALIVVSADVFERAGLFNEALRSVEDQEWLFRAASRGVKLKGIGRTLASYRIMPGGLSADLQAMLKSHDMLIEAAAGIEPELVAKNRRLARAGMLRYCARRAMEHGKGVATARGYLKQMVWTAPDLVVREPLQTLKVAVSVLAPRLKHMLSGRSGALRAEAA